MGVTTLPPRAAWGIGAGLAPLPGGFRNRVLRTTGTGPAFVFKTTRRDEAALAWLAPLHDAARRAGLNAPALLPGTDGALCVGGWTCEPFVAGTPLSRSDMPALAPALERLHDLTAGFPQRPGFAASADLLTQDRGGDVDLGALPSRLAAACRAAWRAVADQPRAALHGDLNPANVLCDAGGTLWLLDWDEARVDARLFDGVAPTCSSRVARARIAWEIACCWSLEPDRARAMTSGFLLGAADAPCR